MGVRGLLSVQTIPQTVVFQMFLEWGHSAARSCIVEFLDVSVQMELWYE